MRWYPRLKLYKYKARSVCTFDPAECRAVSYGHWTFVKRFTRPDGTSVVLFNGGRYSRTTSAHQSMVRSQMDALGIEYVVIDIGTARLDDILGSALNRLWKQYLELHAIQRRPRCKPRTAEIARVRHSIDVLRSIGVELTGAEVFQMQLKEQARG